LSVYVCPDCETQLGPQPDQLLICPFCCERLLVKEGPTLRPVRQDEFRDLLGLGSKMLTVVYRKALRQSAVLTNTN
jgi:DNA-directed RNA polymerase subunit RPC12/RpoP